MDDVIVLLKTSTRVDEYGVRRRTETGRQVFCRCNDVTRSEFFGGGRAGLNPSKTFSVFHADYDGEEIVEHDGLRYAVYRTYHVPGTDDLELHVQREGGTNGAPSND